MICALSHYPIDLSTGGGVRAMNICKIITEIYEDNLTLFVLGSHCSLNSFPNIAQKVIQKPYLLKKLSGGYLCTFPSLIRRQLFSAKIFEKQPSVILLEGPYLGYALLKTIDIPKSAILIYDAHNVEADYHLRYFNWNPFKRLVLKKIESIEKYVMHHSDYVLSTSSEESQIFHYKYHLSRDKIILVPNGVDTSVIKPLKTEERLLLKTKTMNGRPLVIFMGSRSKANVSAARWISERLSRKLPGVTFLIIGNVCQNLKSHCPNVKLMGILSETKKNALLQQVDVAINPVQFGAGTNVKMLEYLASGLPVVCSYMGARGLHLNNREHAIISDLHNFHQCIAEILNNESLLTSLQQNARRKAQEYDWSNIALNLRDELMKPVNLDR